MFKLLVRFCDRAVAVLSMAVRRVIAQRGLALATLAGLIIVIALTISIPIYTEGVYYRVLSEGLFSDTPRYRGEMARPPISFLFRYPGSLSGSRQWEEIVTLDNFFEEAAYHTLHLSPSPDENRVRLFTTGVLAFFTEQRAEVITKEAPSFWISFATIGDPETHLAIIDGTFSSSPPSPGGALEVVIPRFMADRMGAKPGDRYIAYDSRAQHRYDDNPPRFDLIVTGIWEPANPNAEFWEYNQINRDTMLFISEAAFAQRISPTLSDEIYQAIWYLPMDASTIYADEIDQLRLRLEYLQRDVQSLLPNTILDTSPLKILERYEEAVDLLSVLLFAFSIPVISLILTFISLVVALNIERQRPQTASLRSRGASILQILGVATVESGFLGVFALLIALPLSLVLARAIGQTRSFLDFSLDSGLRVGITWSTLRFGVIIVAITLAAQVLPLIAAARQTIVSYRNERARRLRPPWWQRTGLDLLLILPAGYGAYLLRTQGSVFEVSQEVPTDPFQNPLLFLVPALSLLAATLIVLRVLPWLLRGVAWLLGLTRNVGVRMAVLQLARAPGLYTAPLALLILTLGLSTYSASLAATLDNHLHQQQHYLIGADASLVDTGDAIGTQAADSPMPTEIVSQWSFLPVTEYVKLQGVEDATRVGQYSSRINTTSGYIDGSYIGVDRTEFARVAFWREDFAQEPLGGLMNLLALRNDGILLPYDFMTEHILNVGDRVTVLVRAYGTVATLSTTVVGGFEYFPTWYPETGPLVVGNLDYLFQEAHGQIPYRVWLTASSDVDYGQLDEDIWNMNLGAQSLVAAQTQILKEQQRPERQGLLGLLSVGFAIAAILTAVGFVLYALFSFRRRSVELGILRAIGLPTGQMAVFVASELALLILVGGAAGSGLGIWASNAFVPSLQIGGDMIARIPPFVVEIEWPALFRIYALFAILFVVALVILVRLLTQLKLFQAIKLGETQ